MQHSFLKLKKNLKFFFAIYNYIYISIYTVSKYLYKSVNIYIYLYIYIEKKSATFCVLLRSFAKEQNVLVFFYVLCKRRLCSLCSFMFFAKECCILCILLRSEEKTAKERIVLLGFISRQNLKKRTQKNVACFKERKITMRSERKSTRCPTLVSGRNAQDYEGRLKELGWVFLT